MKFSVLRDKLQSALAMMSRVIPSKPPRETLKSVKLVAAGESLTLDGTDCENALWLATDCVVENPGEMLVEFSRLKVICDSFNDSMVSFDATETLLTLRCGHSKFTLGIGRTEEFPSFPKHDGKSVITIVGKELCEALERLAPFSMPQDQNVKTTTWNGVLIESDDTHGIYAVSAYSGGLGWQKLDAQIKGPNVRALVGERAAKLIGSLVGSLGEEVKVTIGESMLSVVAPAGRAICRLNEGNFPQWRNFIPTPNYETTCLRDMLLTSVSQACIPLDSMESGSRSLLLSLADNTLVLSATTGDGDSEVTLPFSWSFNPAEFRYHGPDLRRMLNAFPQIAQLNLFLIEDSMPIRLESGAIGFMLAGMEKD